MSLDRHQVALYQSDIERMHPLMLERLISAAPNVVDMRDVFIQREMQRVLDAHDVQLPCDCA